MKYGIIPIFEEVHKLFPNQYLYIFLICKKAYVEMGKFYHDVVNRANVFNLAKYFNEFLNSKEYNNLKTKLYEDFGLIEAYTSAVMIDVSTNNPKIRN